MKEYNYHGIRGCVAIRKSRTTGVVVALWNARQAGYDEDGGPWVTTCEVHHTTRNHSTLCRAYAWLSTCEWCEECMNEMFASK